MLSTTLSKSFQLDIPLAIREELNLQPGQKFSVINKGGVIELVPIRSLMDARGMLKGACPDNYRDRQDRV